MKKILLIIIGLAFFLRFFKLTEVPPSLYSDEVSLGYNAYSISQTLRDEHGEFLPLARFIAFGDFKPPGYIYAAVPAIKIFGPNEFAVRFPSALAGVLLVLVTYFLTLELFGNEAKLELGTWKLELPTIAALLLAISPWALQFSRGAFEVNLAALFNTSAVLFFLIFAKRNKGWLLPVSVIFFLLSFYTFNANRIIGPLLLVGLSLIFFRQIMESRKWLVISIILGLVMLYPSFSYLAGRESKVRFQEVSIFNNLEVVKTANERIALDDSSWWSKIIHNRRLAFAQEFLKHYFDNFNGRFLFLSGDVNPRLSIQEVGELYIFDLPFLLVGLFYLLRKRDRTSLVIFCWLAVVPIPAATARETPHALRTVSLLPLPQIIVALGVWQVYDWLKRPRVKKLFIGGTTLFLSACVFYYLHNYYIHYPVEWSREWQYGYKEAVQYAASVEKNYDQIIVTGELGRPYIYFLFYQQINPAFYWQTRIASRDWFGFWTVQGFGKYRFGNTFLKRAKGKILFIGVLSETPEGAKELKTINYLNGETALKIVEFQKDETF